MRSNEPTNHDYKQVILLQEKEKQVRFQQDQDITRLLDKLFIKGHYEEK